ncbi:FAD-dependent oxidoreductase [uncultured Friedmanniella sp.]|uniref:FAD-dependent oxidoreductase n=1 Tax=uncultured Friedmanniella sp. TaxID=335381 RepID=UPI0035CB06D1
MTSLDPPVPGPVTGSRYVVIGAGLAGAATAWHLARDGHEVTLVERTRPAATDGSSHGSARIFRYGYTDRLYAELVVRSRAGFDELEALVGRQLITPTGSVDFGEERDPRALAAVLAGLGVEHELLPRAQAQHRFPQLAPDTDVLWHPGAGVIDAEGTVQAMVDLAVGAGAQLATDWPVAEVRRVGSGYRLLSEDGRTIDAERVVVAAGGWLPTLLPRLPLPAGFRSGLPPLEVSQENAYHFPYRDTPEQSWPTSIHGSAAIQTYTLPGGRDAQFRGQKVAEFNAGLKLSTAAHQTGVIDPANRARVIAYVEQYLPGLVPEPYAQTTCLFTNTPTEDFVIDGVDGITIVSACSGHGAKFAPVTGELAAAVATGDGARVPDRFRLGAAKAPVRA